MPSRENRPPSARMADICQILAGDALVWFEPPDSTKFEDLFTVVKSPTLAIERLGMERALQQFTARLADAIHTNFHARFAPSKVCAFAAHALNVRHDDCGRLLVHQSLATWADELRLGFFAAHSSAAQRTRRLLDVSGGVASVDELADAVAVGKRTLERHFRAEIGVSIAEYRTRLRLALVVREVHSRESCIESAALIAGWGTKKGLYDSLHERTGMKPNDVRALSRREMEGLVASLMICGRGANRCVQCSRYDHVCCPRHHAVADYPAQMHRDLHIPENERGPSTDPKATYC